MIKQIFSCIKSMAIIGGILLSLPSLANNVRLGSSVRIVEVGSSDATIEISVSWSNSWRDSYNNDAVWVFFKYRTADTGWEAVLLPETVGLASGYSAMPGYSAGSVVGFFVYRSSAGSGDASTTFRFKWQYPPSLDRTVFESNQVFLMAQGIEMVYIPYGAYTLGDGASNLSFTSPSGGGIDITSNENVEYSILGNSSPASGVGLHGSGSYPAGYEGFYIMKYELSQEQYVAFVNTLSRDDQHDLLPHLPGLNKGDYLFGARNKPSFRNGIVVSVPMTDSKPAVLDNNLSGDGTFGGQDDGRTLACNYMSINDLLGYMSWSGLRPLTETEYEKACRRLLPYTVTPKEYAWGTTNLESMSNIEDATSGWADESPNDGRANAEGRFGTFPGKGPVRCGAFASIARGRETAGSTYSGVMEMSGNVDELCINVTAQEFNGGLHGSGAYYPGEWGLDASSFGIRGGSFASPKERLRVSDRSGAASNYFSSLTVRDSTVGFRGVRKFDPTEVGFHPGEINYEAQQSATVCSGSPFTIANAKDGGSSVLSGLQVTYKWYCNGREIPGATGKDLSYPVGIYNTAKEDSVYLFTRWVYCALGESETDPVRLTVPGKLTMSLPEGVNNLRLSCNVTSPVTASRTSDTRFRWVNASDNKIVKDWSASAQTSSYSPLHKDFGYMGALRRLRCVSDVNGCRDSVEIPLTIESSCSLTVDSALLHMTTNINGGTAVASLCGVGTVKWYYKDNGGAEHLISTATTSAAGSTAPEGTPLSYTTTYKPKYSDFKNTIGQRTVVVRSELGDDSRCKDVRELAVDVKATLDPGEVSAPALACGNTEITVSNTKVAGVDGMSGLTPVYSWYVNGSSTPLPSENGPTLKYRLPANPTGRAVAHTFVRKAATGSPSLQTPYGDTVTITVPGVPEVTIAAPAPACDNTALPLPSPSVNWAGLEGSGVWTLANNPVPSPIKFNHNGQELVYTISNSCHSNKKSNGVNITVYPPTVITTQPVGQTLCQSEPISLSVAASGRELTYQWRKNNADIAGATSAFYSKTGSLPGDGGRYTCVVSGTCGSIISSAVTVTVHPITAISTQPQAQTLCQGGTISLNTSAIGNSLSYQWQKNGSNIGSGSSYSKSSVVPNDGGLDTCVVSGTCGNATTNTVTITVNASTVIISQPSGQTLCQGNTISLTAAATGTNLSYQWKKGSSNIGTGASYTKSGAIPTDGGYYTCVVSGTCGNLTTNTAVVTVNAPVVVSPGSVYASPASVCTGESFTLANGGDASGTCGFGITKYDWYRSNDGAYVGSGASIALSGYGDGTYYFYRRAYVGTGAYANSNTVTVTVASCGPPPAPGGEKTAILCDGKTWMIQNLNDASKGGRCYHDNPSYCASDGRLYTWAEALNACPSGWRLPSDDEFAVLDLCFNKATWNPQYAGYWYSDGKVYGSRGELGSWWSFTMVNSLGYGRYLHSDSERWARAYAAKEYGASVRCVKGSEMVNVNGKTWTAIDVGFNSDWYQAQRTCANLGMRLPNNADWGSLGTTPLPAVPANYLYWSASECGGSDRAYGYSWNDSSYGWDTNGGQCISKDAAALLVRCVK